MATTSAPCRGFLPTPSARRATGAVLSAFHTAVISTHALREEGDRSPQTLGCGPDYFYPRPPRGGRRAPQRLCFCQI